MPSNGVLFKELENVVFGKVSIHFFLGECRFKTDLGRQTENSYSFCNELTSKCTIKHSIYIYMMMIT